MFSAGLLAFAVQPVYADEETEALKKEIKVLEARINQLEKQEKARAQKLSAATKATSAQSAAATPDTMAALKPSAGKGNQSIDQRLSIVERQQEVAQEEAKAKAATAPKLDLGMGKGFTVSSPDRQYAINIRAYAQADNRTFFDGSAAGAATNTFLIRAARPIIEAKMTDYFNARMMWDFGQGNSRLLDAYFDFHPMPGNDIINARGGEMKVPVGIERWQTEQEILFAERGQTTNLVPFRDIGAAVYGQLIPDQLEYWAGIVNGASDLQVNTADTDNGKDFAGRLMAHPLRWSGVQALEGLSVGLAGTYGVHQGTGVATNTGLTTGYLSEGQRAYFTYAPAGGAVVLANGPDKRLNPQMLYYNGPFSLIGEYVREDQEVRNNTTKNNANLTNQAWLGIATYVLTGEDASFDGVKPAHNFDPKSNQWGAFELVARYSQLNVDSRTFPRFANLATSSKEAREGTVGVTWHFNPMFKINLDYSNTAFNGGAATGDRPDEKVVFTRAQFRF
jgi:phosphate-selective porin OprO/OprP